MKKLIGYKTLEAGRKEMILEDVPEKTPEQMAEMRNHAHKVAEILAQKRKR